MSTNIPKNTFKPHINGLRALAILGVLFYHLNAEYCPAGYFGVDIFLVVSGYFLFQSLFKPENILKFSYGNYLTGKAWRILPSWAVVSVIICLIACFALIYKDCRACCGTACASTFFGVDYLLDHYYDYFAPYAHRNLLLHFWYLSITVQLYIIAPLIVVYVARAFSRKVAHYTLFIIAILSFTFYVLTTTPIVNVDTQSSLIKAIGAQSVYYHLLPRLWEVIAGYLIIFMPVFDHSKNIKCLLSAIGLVAILVPFFYYETGSYITYWAVLGTMLLIKYGDEGIILKTLSLKPLQFFGSISFSLYLWHWPIFALWKYHTYTSVTLWDEVGMILVSLFFGYIAWRWIEQLRMPAGEKKQIPPLLKLSIYASLPISGALFVGCMFYSEKNDIVDPEMDMSFLPIKDSYHDVALLKDFSSVGFDDLPAYIGSDTQAEPFFFVMGDSHAQHLYSGLNAVCSEKGVRGIHLNNKVTPFWWYYRTSNGGDSRWDQEKAEMVMNYLSARPKIRYVIISMLWSSRLLHDKGVHWTNRTPLKSEQEHKELTANGLRETCRRIRAMGKEVILLEDTPAISSDPYAMYRRARKVGASCPQFYQTATEYDKNQEYSKELMAELLKKQLVTAVIPAANPLKEGDKYPDRKQGKFLYFDGNHLSTYGSRVVADYVMDCLLEIKNN